MSRRGVYGGRAWPRCCAVSRIGWAPSVRRPGGEDALPFEGVPPRGGAAFDVAGPPCVGMAVGAPIIGPAVGAEFCGDCWAAVGPCGEPPWSAVCRVGGGAVRVSADWVLTVVSSAVGIGSPGAGSRCWTGVPVADECCTGAPCDGTLICGVAPRTPLPVPEPSPLPPPP